MLYDNIPVKDVDEIIERDLQKLIDYEKDKIKLKVIYLMPNIGSFNLTTIKKDIKKLQDENNTQKNDIKILQEENKAQKLELSITNSKYQTLCDENIKLKNKIDELFVEVNKLNDKLNNKI